MLKKGEDLIKNFDKNDSFELIHLWRTCFGDEKEYIESFFKSFGDRIKVAFRREDGRIVSALYCLPAKLVSDENSVEAWYIYAVATLPEYRKRGFASGLIEEVKSLKDEKPALFLTPSNEKNRAFYQSLGFSDSFYNYSFEYNKTKNVPEVVLREATHEELFSMRESCLENIPHVSWDEDHLRFAFGNNVLTALENGRMAGYFHYEKYADNLVIDEICVDNKLLEDTLNAACKFFDVKKVKVCTFYVENCCKNSKGMIYYKFDSVCKEFSKNQFYLGLNLE